jgi:lipoprotein-releasing system permease protein
VNGPTLESPRPADAPPPAEGGDPPRGPAAGHPAPPIFSWPAFLLVVLGTFLPVAATPLVRALVADRLGLSPSLATVLAGVAGALLAGALGAVAGMAGRRLAAWELFFASLLWIAFTALMLSVPRLSAPLRPMIEGQGMLVVVLGFLGAGALSATAAFTGASIAYLFSGGGRLDLSLSYELFVARSHLRLSPRTLAGLFGVVVTGVLPGVLIGLLVSFWRDVQERRAYRRGVLVERARMPATLLMTLISIGGVAMGVWALTVVLSVMSGFEADLKKKILGHTAHGMVLTYGQDEFGDWKDAREKALRVKGVVGATPFLYNEVMLSTGQSLTGAILKGIDVPSIGTVTDLPGSVQDGNLDWLAHPDRMPAAVRGAGDPLDEAAAASDRPRPLKPLPGIVVGRELAHSLRVFVGDQVNVISPLGDLGPAGPQPKSRPFRVVGIFYSGMYEYDAKFAYMDLGVTQSFFGTGDTVTGLEVKVKDVDQARAVLDHVVVALGGWPFRAKDWGELNRSLFSALQMEKVVMAVILGFIVLVASAIIVATLIMQVLEKRKEIAVLKSMGAAVPSIMKIFVIEGVVIGAVGTLFGLLLGYGTCLLVDKVGIPLDPEVYYINNLPVVIDGAQFARVALVALLQSFLATIYPAAKAARLHPVDGLRSE